MTTFSSRRAAKRISKEIDVDALIELLGKRKGELRTLVHDKVYNSVRSHSTSDLLTLTLSERSHIRTVPPSPTPYYAKLLFTYMKTKEGGSISCKIEDIVQESVISAATEFYQSEENIDALCANLSRQLQENVEIRQILEEELRDVSATVSHNIRNAVKASAGTTVAEQLAHQVGQGVTYALNTSLGGACAILLSKALALPAVKLAIAKALAAVLASAAFRKFLLVAMQKIGFVLLLKVILAKTLGLGAGALIGFVVIPIIFAFLVHEWISFPGKIATKMSTEVADKLIGEADKLNQQVVKEFVHSALKEVLNYLGDKLIQPASQT